MSEKCPTRMIPAFLLCVFTFCLLMAAPGFGLAAELSAPSGVWASDGAYPDRVRVTWNPVKSATSYIVYRATSAAGTRTLVYTTTEPPFNDHLVSPLVTYYYWVKAADEFGFSDFSDYDTGYRREGSPTDCVPDETTLCLNNGRFRVEVEWEDQHGQAGVGRVVPTGGDESGVMWFFDPPNWELLIKILNGCRINNRFWVLFAAPTDQRFTVTVTDTQTGDEHRYVNPLKHPADAVIDTKTFDTCSADDLLASEFEAKWAATAKNGAEIAENVKAPDPDEDEVPVENATAVCVPSATQMCLNGGRFEVRVDWRDQEGLSGTGKVVPYGSDDSGLFWFFDASNWEMLVKVLDGCGLNDHFWVFFAATTDQQFTLTVRDTVSGETVEYLNPLKHPADAVTDTRAFDGCP